MPALLAVPACQVGCTHGHYRRLWLVGCLLSLLLVILSGCGGPANAPASTSPAQQTVKLDEWPTYHHDFARSGYLPDMPDAQQLVQSWSTHLDGAVYAEPLVVNGHVLVATENDTLYALNPATGKVVWRTNVGNPVPRNSLPCGDINPLGITGTPVYDAATGLLFAVAEVSGPQHLLVALDAATGALRWQRSVDLPDMIPRNYQQRAALALGSGKVYVAFGGLAGDCATYRGTVVASQIDGQGDLLSYQVPTPNQAGIWSPSGPAIDANGKVYVAVGNGATKSGVWDHSDSVLRLSSTLQLEDGFAPRDWGAENSKDADLGSVGPLLLPNNLVFIEGKSTTAYLLHADHLGGVNGQAAQTMVCPHKAWGGAAVAGSTILVPCADGVRSLTLGPGTKMSAGWQNHTLTLPPVIGGHTIYSLDYNGTLYATDLNTGTIRTQIALSPVAHFATPTISGHSVFVGTLTGVTAVAIS